MTDIEMSISIGAVIVAGVIVYNKWQEYKARKSVARAFSSDHDDVLMREDPREPSFDIHGNGGDAGGDPEPRLGPVMAGTDPATPAAELATSLVDPLIDCLIPLALEVAVRGDKILPVLHTLRHVGNKPVHFIGLHVNGDWEPITHGGVYTKLQAGVQMASRTTALNELEYSELVTRLRALSDQALGEIAGQVREFYQEMEAADIPAGSTRALRLFS